MGRAPEPLDTQQVEREYVIPTTPGSCSKQHHQMNSPCESMLYQASAMEEGAGDDGPVSSEGPPPGSNRFHRQQQLPQQQKQPSSPQKRSEASRYQQVPSGVNSWKNQQVQKLQHQDRDDESVSIMSASSTDWKSRQGGRVAATNSGLMRWTSGDCTTEVPPQNLRSGRSYAPTKSIDPPEVREKSSFSSTSTNGPYQNTPHIQQQQQQQHYPSHARPMYRPSSDNGGHVNGIQGPSSFQQPRQYGPSNVVVNSHETIPRGQPRQYGAKVGPGYAAPNNTAMANTVPSYKGSLPGKELSSQPYQGRHGPVFVGPASSPAKELSSQPYQVPAQGRQGPVAVAPASVPAREFPSESYQVPAQGRYGPMDAANSSPKYSHTGDSDTGGHMYKNVLKPIRQKETPIQSDKPDYSSYIETPEKASVSSLRASFDSAKNQPLMPMNSPDPRIRHSLPISNSYNSNNNRKHAPTQGHQEKQQSLEDMPSPAKPNAVVAQRLSLPAGGGGPKLVGSYRPTTELASDHVAGRSFKYDRATTQDQVYGEPPSVVSSVPADSRIAPLAGTDREGITSSDRSTNENAGIAQSDIGPNAVASVNNTVSSTTFGQSTTNPWKNLRKTSTNTYGDDAAAPARQQESHYIQRDDDITEEVDVTDNNQNPVVVPWAQKRVGQPNQSLHEVKKSWQQTNPHSQKHDAILTQQTMVRRDVQTRTVTEEQTTQTTNRIRQYYKGSWRMEEQNDDESTITETTAANANDERSRADQPRQVAASSNVTRGSVAASWQQRILEQSRKNVIPDPPQTTYIPKSTQRDVPDSRSIDRMSTQQQQQPAFTGWQQKLMSQSSKDSSSSTDERQVEVDSPSKSDKLDPPEQPVIASSEMDLRRSHNNSRSNPIDVKKSPEMDATYNKPTILPWQQLAQAMQSINSLTLKEDPPVAKLHVVQAKSAARTTPSSSPEKEVFAESPIDQQQNGTAPGHEGSDHESADHPEDKLGDADHDVAPSVSPQPVVIPVVDESTYHVSEEVKRSTPTATSKPWEKDTMRSVLQSWQSRALKNREIEEPVSQVIQPKDVGEPASIAIQHKEIEAPVSSAVQPNKGEAEPQQQSPNHMPSYEDVMEEKKSEDLSVDEDTILGDGVHAYLGHSDRRTDSSSQGGLDDSLTGTSKKLSYDGGVDSYISESSTKAEELVVPNDGSMKDVCKAPSLNELGSEEISVYVEDERIVNDQEDRIMEQPIEKVEQKMDAEPDTSYNTGGGAANDGSSPTASKRFPRLSPSPKDSEKYRASYFESVGDNNIPPTRAGDDVAQATNFWSSASASQDEHQAIDFKETDQWLDRDPGMAISAEDASVSSEPTDVVTSSPPRKPDIPKAEDAALAAFDSSLIPQSNTWTPSDNLKVKSRPASDSNNVFDPFSPENDDLKVDLPAELFSPNPDPFMTEESFSPLEWSTPRGTANAQHIGYYNSPDSRLEI